MDYKIRDGVSNVKSMLGLTPIILNIERLIERLHSWHIMAIQDGTIDNPKYGTTNIRWSQCAHLSDHHRYRVPGLIWQT